MIGNVIIITIQYKVSKILIIRKAAGTQMIFLTHCIMTDVYQHDKNNIIDEDMHSSRVWL